MIVFLIVFKLIYNYLTMCIEFLIVNHKNNVQSQKFYINQKYTYLLAYTKIYFIVLVVFYTKTLSNLNNNSLKCKYVHK